MKRVYLFLFGFLISGIACVQISNAQGKTKISHKRKISIKQIKPQAKPKIRFINPTTLARTPNYTHVVEVTGGRTIYISGQISLDATGNLVGRGDFRAQTEQVFQNLKLALESVGASFKDVIKLNMYVTDITQLSALREVRDKYVNTQTPPASTLVEVRKLAREELLIEIEAVAVYLNKNSFIHAPSNSSMDVRVKQ